MMMALGALAMGARAQDAVAPDVQQSVLMVLAQAIPSDSVAYALASSSAFAAEMASSLSAGNTNLVPSAPNGRSEPLASNLPCCRSSYANTDSYSYTIF